MSMAKIIHIYTAFTLAYLQAVAGMFRTGVEWFLEDVTCSQKNTWNKPIASSSIYYVVHLIPHPVHHLVHLINPGTSFPPPPPLLPPHQAISSVSRPVITAALLATVTRLIYSNFSFKKTSKAKELFYLHTALTYLEVNGLTVQMAEPADLLRIQIISRSRFILIVPIDFVFRIFWPPL